MWLVPVLALCLAATAIVDLALALYGLARSDLFWPSAFCASLGGLSAALMVLAFLDFDASAPLYAVLVALGAAAALSLLPAIRSVT